MPLTENNTEEMHQNRSTTVWSSLWSLNVLIWPCSLKMTSARFTYFQLHLITLHYLGQLQKLTKYLLPFPFFQVPGKEEPARGVS